LAKGKRQNCRFKRSGIGLVRRNKSMTPFGGILAERPRKRDPDALECKLN
jgi:hypothetical protein